MDRLSRDHADRNSVYDEGTLGLFSMPLVVIAFPLLFMVMPRLWRLARAHGNVTAADLVHGQYEGRGLGVRCRAASPGWFGAASKIVIVKDMLMYVTVIAAVIIVRARLGGYGAVLAAIPPAKPLLSPLHFSTHATLALGSALAMFMYPHSMTAVAPDSNGASYILTWQHYL